MNFITSCKQYLMLLQYRTEIPHKHLKHCECWDRKTGWSEWVSERKRRTLCRNGVFQYCDDLQIWNPFSNVLESNSLPSPDFYQKQTLLEGFLKVVWTLWEMRLQGRYGATVLSPTSHVPMCVLSEMHQFLGETESVQMERHTCASTCTQTAHA